MLYKNYNNKFMFPVHIFHYDDIYSPAYIKDIQETVEPTVQFHQLSYRVPDNIQEEELFYNKTFLKYVKLNFSKKRIGYLHANYFWNNFYKNPILSKYDYTMRIDDDSFFTNQLDENMFQTLKDKHIRFGTGYTFDTDKYAADVRYKLFEFVKDFCKDNDVVPKNNILQKALETDNPNCITGKKGKTELLWNCGNCNVYDMKMFKEAMWEKWNDKFNQIAGGYRYRWGDIEMIGLYTYLFHEPSVHDFRLKDRDVYRTGNTDFIRVGTAPSTKE